MIVLVERYGWRSLTLRSFADARVHVYVLRSFVVALFCRRPFVLRASVGPFL